MRTRAHIYKISLMEQASEETLRICSHLLDVLRVLATFGIIARNVQHTAVSYSLLRVTLLELEIVPLDESAFLLGHLDLYDRTEGFVQRYAAYLVWLEIDPFCDVLTVAAV